MPANYYNPKISEKASATIPQVLPGRLELALFLLATALAIIAVGTMDNVAAGAGLIGVVISVMLIKRPQLALAILFNGVILYFYLLCKFGLETSRITTAAFYFVLVATAFLGSALVILQQRQTFRLGAVDILFIFFFLYIFLSYFFFSARHHAAYIKIGYAPLMVVGPYFATMLLSSVRAVHNFFRYCVILAAVLIIPSFCELLFNPAFENSARFSAYELNGLDNPILFGLTFGNLLIIVGTWIIEKDGLKLKHIVVVMPSIFLLIRSGSRGALLSFIVTMIAGIAVVSKIKPKTKFLSIIICVLLFMSAYYFIPESTIDFYKSTLDYQYMPQSSVSQRFTMWQQAIKDFANNPILGVGVGNSVWGGGFPHNIILEVAAELGLIGLFMFLAISYLSVKNAISCMKREKDIELRICMKISLLLFIYAFVEALFTGYITNQTQLFVSIAIISAITKIQQRNNSSSSSRCFSSSLKPEVPSCE
ncbi:MAG: O-antigen ligase family protein [Phycisphaerae bacterium]|nr:O-antigen ligase family protein [Phycisphaerae bacterium]